MFKSSYMVRFDDVDAAGIVYYPRYFHYCHLALEDLFDQRGLHSYHHLINERRLGFPTVHVDADFRSPLFYGDRVDIELTVKNIKNSSLLFAYSFVKNGDARACFHAHITTVCVDLIKKVATPVPEDLREFFGKIKAEG